jgi:hypothetical protein
MKVADSGWLEQMLSEQDWRDRGKQRILLKKLMNLEKHGEIRFIYLLQTTGAVDERG